MTTAEEIQATIIKGRSYYLELMAAHYAENQKDCNGDVDTLLRIKMAQDDLEYLISDGEVSDQAEAVYACYLGLIFEFSGQSLSIDPNASIPGVDIDIIVPGTQLPFAATIDWSEMTGSDGAGGRNRYDTPSWEGFSPFLIIAGVELFEGVDFDNLPTGGFVLKAGGNRPFMYEGEKITALNYEPI